MRFLDWTPVSYSGPAFCPVELKALSARFFPARERVRIPSQTGPAAHFSITRTQREPECPAPLPVRLAPGPRFVLGFSSQPSRRPANRAIPAAPPSSAFQNPLPAVQSETMAWDSISADPPRARLALNEGAVRIMNPGVEAARRTAGFPLRTSTFGTWREPASIPPRWIRRAEGVPLQGGVAIPSAD